MEPLQRFHSRNRFKGYRSFYTSKKIFKLIKNITIFIKLFFYKLYTRLGTANLLGFIMLTSLSKKIMNLISSINSVSVGVNLQDVNRFLERLLQFTSLSKSQKSNQRSFEYFLICSFIINSSLCLTFFKFKPF